MKIEVKYTGHSKWCHPETCSCREWSLFIDGNLIGDFYSEENALTAKISILQSMVKTLKGKSGE